MIKNVITGLLVSSVLIISGCGLTASDVNTVTTDASLAAPVISTIAPDSAKAAVNSVLADVNSSKTMRDIALACSVAIDAEIVAKPLLALSDTATTSANLLDSGCQTVTAIKTLAADPTSKNWVNGLGSSLNTVVQVTNAINKK
jgi:PBP1b-binding outer membrane lipoprotein LpoB